MSNAENSKTTRNKETTPSTSKCLQWAISQGIGEHLRLTDAEKSGERGQIVLHVLYVNKTDGLRECEGE
jgi:hypothetical protein